MKLAVARGLALLILGLALAACGGGGGGGGQLIDPNSGRLAGVLRIVGPFDPAAVLRIRLLVGGTDIVKAETEAPVGRVPAATQAYFNGRAIHYGFAPLFYGTYSIQIFSGSGNSPDVLFTSPALLPGFNGETVTYNSEISFTGGFPYGSAEGRVLFSGDWPPGRSVFLGFEKTGGDGRLLRWPLREEDAAAGELPFSVDGLAIGWYRVALYSQDADGSIAQHGALPELLIISGRELDASGLEIAASFDGSPV